MSVLDNLKAANATGTARGTFPIIKNSANGKFKNLKLFGASTKAEGQIESVVLNSVAACEKNFLNCGKLTTQNINDVTFTPVYENGLLQYINVNGTATADAVLLLTTSTREEVDLKSLTGKNIILSGCPNGGSSSTYKFQFWSDSKMAVDTGNGATLDLSTVPDTWNFAISIIKGTTVNNLTFYPMIRDASIADATYKPYKGNIANLPETIEMNGIGELKDYIDYERGVFVQKFGVAVLDGSEDEGWYTMETQTAGVKRIYTRTFKVKNSASIYVPATNILCSHYEPISASDTYLQKQGIATTTADNYIYIYDNTFNTSNISLWKAHLAANPITIVYELEEPIETPLSPAALLELDKLRTFDSITCVSNDAGAEMEIDYFKNNATGQEMSDIHAGVPRFILDGTTLHIIV